MLRTCKSVLNNTSYLSTTWSASMSKKSKRKAEGAASATAAVEDDQPVTTGKSGLVQIKVLASPGAKHSSITGIDERVRVAIAAPPTDGKANKELVLFMAKACGVKKSQVDLATGQKSRDKLISISDSTADYVLQKLQDTLQDGS